MTDENTGTAPAASPAEAVVETSTPAPAPQETSASETIETADSSLDADLVAVWDKNANAGRDDRGRFAPANTDAAKSAGVETEGQIPSEGTAETAEPSIPAPHSWPAEMKAKWATLPPDAREYIAKRESEAHSTISRMGQTVKAFQPVAETLEQHREVFERNGLGYQDGIKALLNAQIALEQNPVAAINHLAKAYGVDLAKVYGGNGEQPSGQPHIAALEAQIANLNRQLQETSQRVMTREHRETEAQRQTLESVVSEFLKDKPDFDAIEPDVMSLLPAIRDRNPGASPRELLAEAYEKAQWVNPDARARRLDADRKAAEAKAAEENAKRAAEAKKHTALNVKTGQSSTGDRKTMDDTLQEIARRAYAR